VADVVDKFGVTPEQVGDFLALVGDKSDNVTGVPGVGPVKAAKLLKEYGDLESVLTKIAAAQPSALRDSVIEHADVARLARKLVALDSDAPIDFDQVFVKREPQPIVEVNADDLAPEEQEENEPPPLTEITTREPRKDALATRPSFEMQLQPDNLKAAAALGAAIYNSRLFPKLPNAEAITAVILRGREMGITALTACQVFHYFDGQLTMHAHLIIAEAEKHPDCEWFRYVDGDATFAEYETKHRAHPSPTRLRYTIEQATTAGLVRATSSGKPSNWQRIPAEMLRKTCGVQLARIVYPSAALGLYCAEEIGADV
jgi:hypothetical protein